MSKFHALLFTVTTPLACMALSTPILAFDDPPDCIPPRILAESASIPMLIIQGTDVDFAFVAGIEGAIEDSGFNVAVTTIDISELPSLSLMADNAETPPSLLVYGASNQGILFDTVSSLNAENSVLLGPSMDGAQGVTVEMLPEPGMFHVEVQPTTESASVHFGSGYLTGAFLLDRFVGEDVSVEVLSGEVLDLGEINPGWR